MARTVKTDVIIPDIFTDAVQAAIGTKSAFIGSGLASSGAVIVDGSFPHSSNNVIGRYIDVPYFGTIPKFATVEDGDAVDVNKIGMTQETATIARKALAVEATRWAQNGGLGNSYDEAARLIVERATQAMDEAVIDAAVADGSLAHSAYSSSNPRYIDSDLVLDAKSKWGDEGDQVVAMITHSRVKNDILKLKDSTGRPMAVEGVSEGNFSRFCGMTVVESDRVPLTGSSMGSVTSAGTSPPVVTLSGTPNGAHSLKIKITLGGARGTAKFKFSADGGATYSAEFTTAASVELTDSAVDSTVGINGTTGITAAFATGSDYNVDNTYVATALLKARSLLVKKSALAFWYNKSALRLQTDHDILRDSDLAAMHLYYAAHRYRRANGGTKCGVVVIDHNVRSYIG